MTKVRHRRTVGSYLGISMTTLLRPDRALVDCIPEDGLCPRQWTEGDHPHARHTPLTSKSHQLSCVDDECACTRSAELTGRGVGVQRHVENTFPSI